MAKLHQLVPTMRYGKPPRKTRKLRPRFIAPESAKQNINKITEVNPSVRVDFIGIACGAIIRHKSVILARFQYWKWSDRRDDGAYARL